jgi:hypothetical protein
MTIKQEVTEQLEKVDRLREEARVQLHLASMDAKKEWNERLEPRIAELEGTAHQASEAMNAKVKALVQALEAFVTRLRTVTP